VLSLFRIIPLQQFCGTPGPGHRPVAFFAEAGALDWLSVGVGKHAVGSMEEGSAGDIPVKSSVLALFAKIAHLSFDAADGVYMISNDDG